MEDKKGGGRVSQIANIFSSGGGGGSGGGRAMSPGRLETSAGGGGGAGGEAGECGGGGPVSVVRTESHLARFNNARALFEKLGSTGTLDEPPPPLVHTKPKKIVVTDPSSKIDSNQHGTGTVLRQVNGGTGGLTRCHSAGGLGGPAGLLHNGNSLPGLLLMGSNEKPAKPEKPERKLNSRELIEKQKNWTSHFSKNRTALPRYNSDPKCENISPVRRGQDPVRSSSFNSPREDSNRLICQPSVDDYPEKTEKVTPPSSFRGRLHPDCETPPRGVSPVTSPLRTPAGGGGGGSKGFVMRQPPPPPPPPPSQVSRREEKEKEVEEIKPVPRERIFVTPRASLEEVEREARSGDSPPERRREEDETKKTGAAAGAVSDGIYQSSPVTVIELAHSVTPVPGLRDRRSLTPDDDERGVEGGDDSSVTSSKSLVNFALGEESGGLTGVSSGGGGPLATSGSGSGGAPLLVAATSGGGPLLLSHCHTATATTSLPSAAMSNSLSEEDSGFASSETVPNHHQTHKETESTESWASEESPLVTSDSRELLSAGHTPVEDSTDDIQFIDQDQEEEKVDISLMTPAEADQLLSTRIVENRTGGGGGTGLPLGSGEVPLGAESLLSDEEAQEVVKLLSPPSEETSEPEWLKDVLQASQSSLLSSTTTLGSNTMGIGDSMEDWPSQLTEPDLSKGEELSSTQESPLNQEEEEAVDEEDAAPPAHLSSPSRPRPYREIGEEDGVHYLEDGHYWLEMPGLDDGESDTQQCPIKLNRKVQFSQGPIKVYSTFSVSDYDRRNEDVDPVAASAEYELEKRVEKLTVFPVDLVKGPDGLGLSIIGMGVGADAGLEKLGIFVKTITDRGAAATDGRIQVNDQIIEVDGKSLVGVTQAYAASVLRNTCGRVRFLIGREQDPESSEVAQLIRQSLQADREREEARRAQERRYSEDSQSTNSEENNATLSSLLQESQMKQAAAESEVMRLRNRLEELEKGAREDLGERLRETSLRLRETERQLTATKKDQVALQEMLHQTQEQYLALEKKYTKTKKLVREFHEREAELLHREEFYLETLQEKDREYNALVKALKDRIIQVEEELMETQRRAGLPVHLPQMSEGAYLRLNTPPLTRRPPPVTPLLESLGVQLPPGGGESEKTSTVERKPGAKEELDDAVPPHNLLDVSATKAKGELASRGGLGHRQLPSQAKKHHTSSSTSSLPLSNSSSDYGLTTDESTEDSDLDSERDHASPDPWANSTTAPPRGSLAEQLKQVLAERERRLSSGSCEPAGAGGGGGGGATGAGAAASHYSPTSHHHGGGGLHLLHHSSSLTSSHSSVPQSLVEEIRHAVAQANLKVKKGWPQAAGSPSSSGSVSPGVLTADPSPSKIGSSDSSDIWIPQEERRVQICQNTPIPEWTSEQITYWLESIGLEGYSGVLLEAGVSSGQALLALEPTKVKSSLGISGQGKSVLKKRLKELRARAQRERRQSEKERRERERLLKKAEKLAEKPVKRK